MNRLQALRSALVKRFGALKRRPIIGHDFDALRFVYFDLFNHNSEAYSLAGRPDFPVNSDTNYPTTGEAFNQLCRNLQREVFLKIAYSSRKAKVPTRSQYLRTRTNHTHRLVLGGEQITKISIRAAASETVENLKISLSKESQKTDCEAKYSDKALRLFEQFLSLRRNGLNPLGRILRIPFEEFINVYGYGQCYNQSYALADLFARNKIAVRLIHIHHPRHVLVEAEVEPSKWAAFDPLLSQAFLDPVDNTPVSFVELQTNLETVLKRFRIKNIEEAKAYYSADAVTVEAFQDANVERNYSFNLGPNQDVEYSFAESYPWVHRRNLTSPPEEVLGHFKHFWGKGTKFLVTSPYPIVEAEVSIGARETELAVAGVEVAHQPGWDLVRLSRYLDYQKTLTVTSSQPVNLTTISQFSALPYPRTGDVSFRVDGTNDVAIDVRLECASC